MAATTRTAAPTRKARSAVGTTAPSSCSPTVRPPIPPADITFCGDLESAVARAKEAAGDKYVTILGANVAKQCLEAGLLDEVLVFVAPVLLGDGVPLFRSPGGTNVRLIHLPGETEHWYRVDDDSHR